MKEEVRFYVFQFLIGRLATKRGLGEPRLKTAVSIPYR